MYKIKIAKPTMKVSGVAKSGEQEIEGTNSTECWLLASTGAFTEDCMCASEVR